MSSTYHAELRKPNGTSAHIDGTPEQINDWFCYWWPRIAVQPATTSMHMELRIWPIDLGDQT